MVHAAAGRSGTFSNDQLLGPTGPDPMLRLEYGPNGVAVVGVGTPAIGGDDVTTAERDTGSHDAVVHLHLTRQSEAPVTVRVATAAGTATSGTDFAAVPSTTVAFAPGQTDVPVLVHVNGDTVPEGNEAFRVRLSSPSSNAVVEDTSGTGTIVDDEGPIHVYAHDAGVTEGNSGATNMAFTVALSRAPAAGQIVKVDYAT